MGRRSINVLLLIVNIGVGAQPQEMAVATREKTCSPDEVVEFWGKVKMDESKVRARQSFDLAGITEDEVPVFAESIAMGWLDALQSLRLVSMSLSEDCAQCAQHIADALGVPGALAKLHSLEFTKCNITDKVVAPLFDAIGTGALAGVTTFRVMFNPIVDNVGPLIRAIAKGLPALETLSLAGNRLSATSLQDFASAIPGDEFVRLQSLYLHSNRITAAGVTALASVIGRGGLNGLNTLFLGTNEFGDDGMIALASAITKTGVMPNLVTLNLAQIEGLTETGLVALSTALAAPGSLPSLKFLRLMSKRMNLQLKEVCASRGISVD